MAQPVDYKFYLYYTDSGVDYYYYLNAGVTDTTTTPTVLSRAPEGWQEMEIGIERGFTYYGLFTSYSTPLKFFKDGAEILRYIAYTNGIEWKLKLKIEQLRRSDYSYQTFFIGDVDLSKTQDEFDYIVAPVMEGGFVEKLKSRDNTNYDMPLEDNADVNYIEHDGIPLQAKLSYTSTQQAGEDPLDNVYEYPVWTYYDTEGTNLSLLPVDVDDVLNEWVIAWNTSPNSVDCTIKIKGLFGIHTTVGYTGGEYFRIRATTNDSAFASVANYDIYQSPATLPTFATTNCQVDISYDITIPSGHFLIINHYVSGANLNTYWDTFYCPAELGLYITNRFETTYIPSLKALDVFDFLMQSINADALNPVNVSSGLLASYTDQIYFTSGDGLRSLPKSRMRVNFADFFKWANVKFGAMFYYDRATNTAYLEHKSVGFNNVVNPSYPLISSVDNFKCTPFTSELFTNLKIGTVNHNYDKNKSDEQEITNGKDEFNVTLEFQSPMTRVNGALADYVQPYNDDMYGIELVRANLSGKLLADAESDNEIYILHCEDTNSGTYTLIDGTVVDTRVLYRKTINLTPGVNYWNVQGIFSPATAYNILFSSQRCLYRNGDYFRSLMKLNDNENLEFIVGGKTNATNIKLSTGEGSPVVGIFEGLTNYIFELCTNGQVLFKPFIFEFETREEINLYNILLGSQFKYLTFTYRGETYSGFILQAVSKPTFRGTTNFKLLASPNTDISKLIR